MKVIAGVGMLIVVAVGAWYALSKPFSQDEIAVTGEVSVPENWKTYNRPDLGISLKYPPIFKYEIFESSEGVGKDSFIAVFDTPDLTKPEGVGVERGVRMTVDIRPYLEGETVSDRCTILAVGSPNLLCKQVRFKGYSAYVTEENSIYKSKSIHIGLDDRVISVSAEWGFDDESKKLFPEFDQVISTLEIGN